MPSTSTRSRLTTFPASRPARRTGAADPNALAIAEDHVDGLLGRQEAWAITGQAHQGEQSRQGRDHDQTNRDVPVLKFEHSLWGSLPGMILHEDRYSIRALAAGAARARYTGTA